MCWVFSIAWPRSPPTLCPRKLACENNSSGLLCPLASGWLQPMRDLAEMGIWEKNEVGIFLFPCLSLYRITMGWLLFSTEGHNFFQSVFLVYISCLSSNKCVLLLYFQARGCLWVSLLPDVKNYIVLCWLFFNPLCLFICNYSFYLINKYIILFDKASL